MRRTVIVALAALGFSLAALSVAWACTSDASMHVSNYNPMPGEVIHATGADYYANAEVKLHWGSTTGPVLAVTQTTAENRAFVEDGADRGSFAVDVPIPAEATPGDHILYAVSPGARVAPVRLTIPGEVAEEPDQDPQPAPADQDPQPAPADQDPQPAPASQDPQPAPAPQVLQPEPAPQVLQPEPAPEATGASTPAPAEEQVLAGATQAVAAEAVPEVEAAPAPVVNTDWRNTHGALLHAGSTPVAVVNTDWRNTHGALLHAVPDSLEVDSGAFADAVAASEENGYAWAGSSDAEGPVGIGAGLALFAPGLMLLFGGFTVAAVARRRERVPATHR